MGAGWGELALNCGIGDGDSWAGRLNDGGDDGRCPGGFETFNFGQLG